MFTKLMPAHKRNAFLDRLNQHIVNRKCEIMVLDLQGDDGDIPSYSTRGACLSDKKIDCHCKVLQQQLSNLTKIRFYDAFHGTSENDESVISRSFLEANIPIGEKAVIRLKLHRKNMI